jgi:hypothetical protein
MTQDQANEQAPSAAEAGRSARRLAPRLLMYAAGATILALIMLVLGMYTWKTLAVRNLDQKLEVQRNEMTEERRQALEVQASDMLRITARPLAWAVRAEMIRGNLGQVDDYFRDFVREAGVLSIVLIDKDGQVALATNRKLETQPADGVVSQKIMDADDVVIEELGATLRLGVPIMSFNEKLGVLVLDYQPRDSRTPKSQPETPPST